jgi:hypothetical protein
MKSLPDILTNHILPFDWDVRLVWQESVEVVIRPLVDFAYLLDLPLWSSVPNQGMLFDISPRKVIDHPQRSPHQYERIQKADTDFPIDLLRYQEREWILDGVHRLAKLFIIGAESARVRVHSDGIISRITR